MKSILLEKLIKCEIRIYRSFENEKLPLVCKRKKKTYYCQYKELKSLNFIENPLKQNHKIFSEQLFLLSYSTVILCV